MKKKVVLSWKNINNSTSYFINKRFHGNNDEGFRSILKYISSRDSIGHIIIKYPTANTNSADLYQHFPFYEFVEEFLNLAEKKSIVIEFEPLFTKD